MGFSRGRVAMSSSCSCAGGGCRNGDMIVIEARSRQLRTGGAHFAHCPILGPINCWQFTAPKAVSSPGKWCAGIRLPVREDAPF